jgi:ankyrin repeat protein
MSSSVSIYNNTANNYYAGNTYWDFRKICTDSEEFDEEIEQGDKAYKKLRDFIRNDNLSGLISSNEFKNFGINYRFGEEKNTLLHAAYRYNKPETVEFLVKNGADERIPDDRGLIPIEVAQDTYLDSLPRVINEVVQRYFKSLEGSSPNNPHVLFDVIQNFIHEKKWKYFDTEGSRKHIPFRDGRLLSSLGLPELTYHVNCADLTNLFIKTAHKIGMDAQEVWYREYNSIQGHEKEKNGIVGKLAMFDGSNNSEKDLSIRFNTHCVAYSSGWHFDLTLMCKYQDRNAVLRCQ